MAPKSRPKGKPKPVGQQVSRGVFYFPARPVKAGPAGAGGSRQASPYVKKRVPKQPSRKKILEM